MSIDKNQIEEWIEALTGDQTARYQMYRRTVAVSQLLDNLEELCRLALKQLENEKR